MNYKYSFLMFIGISIGCNNNQQKKVVEFEAFKITVPNTWEKLEIKGIDSEVGGILTESGDSIVFDYGKHTYNMDFVLNVNDIQEYQKLDSLGFDVDDLVFSKYPGVDQNQGTFHNEYYMYESINNHLAKVSVPKNSGKGTIGVYFDELDNGNSLYIHGNNLTEKEEKELLESFKTIHIK